MTPRIERLKRCLLEHRHHACRRDVEWKLAEKFENQNLPPLRRVSEALAEVLKAETPVFLPEERIAFTRAVRTLPELYTEEEVRKMRSEFSFAEKGVVFNLCCDFAATISAGLGTRRAEVVTRMGGRDNAFLSAVLLEIDAVLDLTERYRREAENSGRQELASLLSRVPRQGARTFHEALQFFRILHYTLWCEGEYHNGIGRFDQYMLPYLERDLAAGRETEESAFELLEEFFLSFHRDSDLYLGVQQGDNGQSMVLGGCGRDGMESSNILTLMCLRASKELAVIDPKINLRVSMQTPRELFELGTELTAAGLGFPQYSNDDVVIPALLRWGYSLEDARNYVVAACWEFTIPGRGMDVPNIDAVSLPAMLLNTLGHSHAATFSEFMDEYAQTLRSEAISINAKYRNFTMLPGPFASLLCDGCIERGRDIGEGGKYNNFGVHGTGISTAVDSLAALEQLVFAEKRYTLEEFREAIADDFARAPELLAAVRNTAPKLGSGDGKAEEIARQLLAIWGEAWSGLRNIRGGIWRPGTGSAMYYITHSQTLPATPDGRLAGEPFPANYAPSLTVPQTGPVSVIRDFAGAVIPQVCNGGPLTIELHDSVFREPDGIGKTASLVQLFCKSGGHQLQLNAIDRDTLLDAQEHPELHRNLIVRVWGWSGYFVELDKVFQDHIIGRTGLSFP